MSEQQGWRVCRKCLSSCYEGLLGVCSAGGAHDFEGSEFYALSMSAPAGVPSQDGWRWCRKCQVLFHPGEGAGVCPGGGGHDHSGSGVYYLAMVPYAAGGQEGWRYCKKCHALHLPGASAGSCPAGGVHTETQSIPYSMQIGVPPGCSIPQSQPGWRRCCKCHASCFGGLPGACSGGGQHDFQGSAWYGIPTEAIAGGHSQYGWRYCKKCQILFHPGEGAGACPSGGGHEQDPQGCNYRLAISPYVSDGQQGWRYCAKCHALHLPDGTSAACPAGGEHADTSSLPYSMLLQIPHATILRPSQPGWRLCRKCQASCFGGVPGACASGGKHDFQDSAWYSLPTEPPFGVNSQDGWRYCKKCQVLFHPGEGAGACPSGGGHEQDPQGCSYQLAISPYPTDGQEGWRYCGKCHVMHLPGKSSGTCAAGGEHAYAPSLPYSMLLGTPILPAAQSGWRRCRKCRAGCYAGLEGLCVAGGQHDFEGSTWYALATAAPTDLNYQDGWRWCKKCQVLFHPGLGVGVCPAGGGHENPPGNPYHLAIAPYASSGQEGWRYCSKCHVMHLPDGSAGPCAAGGVHTETPSAPYSMRLQNKIDIQCKLITDYDEKQQPQSRFEVVLTPRGADGSLLHNSVVKVLASSPVNLIQEQNGIAALRGLDSGTPLQFTTSVMGRVRFTIIPTHDKLSIPDLFAQSAAMGIDQWVQFSPDDELHTQLAGLTGDKLVTTPAGKVGPLLPPDRAADAQALAIGVSQVMSRFSPQATTTDVALSFGFWDDIADGFESVGGAIVDAATAAANQATSVANSLYDTIASQTSEAMSSASRYLDTVGSAAQLLIQNANSALLVPADHFVTKSISSATQLAIDVGNQVVVLALEVVDGVRRLVKIVVDTVESAAMIAVEFFKRVGLTIKAVIEFLAALFDWDAILGIQSEIQTALNSHLSGFGGYIDELRPKLGGYMHDLDSKIDNLGSSGSPSPAPSSLVQGAMSVGGQFGYLMDKVLSYVGGSLSIPLDLGLGDLPLPPMPSDADVEAFVSTVMASPLVGALQDPSQLLSWSPETLLDIIKPLAKAGLTIMRFVVDGLLAITPTVVSAIHGILQQRISIPFLTDFIEIVVFRRRQQLSLLSLITLLAAAFKHVVGTVVQAASDAFSFADEPEASLLPYKDAMIMCLVGSICGSLHQAFALGMLTYYFVQATEGRQPSAEVMKFGRFGEALFTFISSALGVPFTYGTPRDSSLFVEQMLCFSFRMTAGMARIALLGLSDPRSNEDEDEDESGSKLLKTLRWITFSAGALTIVTTLVNDLPALYDKNFIGQSFRSGDKQLIYNDLMAQLAYGISNVTRPFELPPALDQGKALLCSGAISVGGYRTFAYSVSCPCYNYLRLGYHIDQPESCDIHHTGPKYTRKPGFPVRKDG